MAEKPPGKAESSPAARQMLGEARWLAKANEWLRDIEDVRQRSPSLDPKLRPRVGVGRCEDMRSHVGLLRTHDDRTSDCCAAACLKFCHELKCATTRCEAIGHTRRSIDVLPWTKMC